MARIAYENEGVWVIASEKPIGEEKMVGELAGRLRSDCLAALTAPAHPGDWLANSPAGLCGHPQNPRWLAAALLGFAASGSFLAPVLIFSVEIIGILILIIMGAVWLTTQPDILNQLRELAGSMRQAEPDPLVIQSMLTPYLTRPGVILAAFTFTALFVPLVEELLKPIGVWFLAGSALTPARGFAAGVLCGAGYALFESLGLANSGDLWSGLVIARMGTAAVHIFTTALTGWALAIAWKDNRYLFLGAVYLLNVLVHGLWNAFTLTIIFTELPRVGSNFQRIVRIGEYAPYVLIGLTVLTFTGLLVMNLRLSRHQPGEIAPQTSGIIPPIAKETNGSDI